jgi:hypothetical protein
MLPPCSSTALRPSAMLVKPLLFVLAAAYAQGALAQAEPDRSYAGNWSATIVTTDGKRLVSRLVLKQFDGTWHGPTTLAKAACNGKKAPVTVQETNALRLAFTVWGKTTGPQCNDLTIEMKPVAENVFEGTVESVGTIRLTRR